ncbi:dTMP kinase [Sphingosinicella sp. LHD-64]|uniref:dTMP kinase n=1 Tax=Sphingosinicella sp. LHD-64 TaxID=3072139 RepID=UPI00280F2A53|nr:dTMP kinase [Sphingosinicella sp. LHD-64]MDQ8754800.1 dTMP kinase [Sphingosinicella sp. LHD-64]
MTGRFITLEGGEGVGKSTQAKALAAALRARGVEVVETREPGGSPGAEAIRQLLLQGAVDRWSAEAEALLFAAARSDHVARTIRPALDLGKWVVCDRFLDSSIAYQGIVGHVGADAIRQLHEIGSGGFLPDRTLLLQMEGRAAAERTRTRDTEGPDRFGARDSAYHDRIGFAFEVLADEDPTRIRKVDAAGTAAEVTGRLVAALADLL